MLGFLFYLDTIVFAPYIFAFVVSLYAIAFRRHQLNIVARKNIGYIRTFLVFLFLCTFNSVVQGFKGIPNMYMQVFMLATAFALNKKDARSFIILTCAECLIGVAEYSMGVSSFVQADPDFFEGEELLYFKRVNGLSGNSSTLSEKILISAVLLYGIKDDLKKKLKASLLVILLAGFFITFNRTAIITYLVFLLCIAYQRYKHKAKGIKILAFFILICVVLPAGIILWDNFGELITLQFSRGDTGSMLTGRPYIWSLFGTFISDNLLFGNGSVHLLVPYYSGMIHAHNSFIQLLADQGIILSLIYLLNIFLRFNKHNWLYCLPFVVLSLTQYTLFWGYSMGDVFFFAFLCNPYIVSFCSEIQGQAAKPKHQSTKCGLLIPLKLL